MVMSTGTAVVLALYCLAHAAALGAIVGLCAGLASRITVLSVLRDAALGACGFIAVYLLAGVRSGTWFLEHGVLGLPNYELVQRTALAAAVLLPAGVEIWQRRRRAHRPVR